MAIERAGPPGLVNEPSTVLLVRSALGLITWAAASVGESLSIVHRGESELPGARSEELPHVGVVPAAAAGVCFASLRGVLRTTDRLQHLTGPALRVVLQHGPLAWVSGAARAPLAGLADSGRDELRASSAVSARLMQTLLPVLSEAIVQHLDLDGIVDRVDVSRVAERIDVNNIADRIDVSRVAERIDVNDIADRVDVDRIALRVNLDAIVARLDLPSLVSAVLDELDVGDLIRESSSTMAVETVDAVRAGGVSADARLARAVDRLLFRRQGRHLDVDTIAALEAPASAPDTRPVVGNSVTPR